MVYDIHSSNGSRKRRHSTLERALGSKISRDLDEISTPPSQEKPRKRRTRNDVFRQASAFERMFGGKLSFELEDFVKPKADLSAEDSDSGQVVGDVYIWDPKSFRIRMVNWGHLYTEEYRYYLYNLILLVLVTAILSQLSAETFAIVPKLSSIRALASNPIFFQVAAVIIVIVSYVNQMKPPVYCMENCVFAPPKSWRVSQAEILTMMRAQGCFAEETLEFTKRVLDKSGTSDSTHWPPSMIPCRDGQTPAIANVDTAREEAKAVIFPLVREVIQRSQVPPQDIDILIVNCSLFSPTPSLCALVCNEFGLREDVRTFNLGGMGCSANVIAVDLAKELLQNKPGSRALVISTENLTQNLYHGNDKAMLLQNTLFRCGGCALLLSSRLRDSVRAKYKLLYTFRAQVSSDQPYNCVYQKQDSKGNMGVALSKDIVSVAGQAMKRNFIQLGPHVLPFREQAKVVCNRIGITVLFRWKKLGWPLASYISVPRGYTPNFSKGIDHFCIHAGGRAVIEGVQKNLNLRDDQVAPSFQTLHDWGNTSSSSIWYEADWVERFGGLKRGHRVLQIAFGSGFKCNSAVWLALRVDDSKRGVPLTSSD